MALLLQPSLPHEGAAPSSQVLLPKPGLLLDLAHPCSLATNPVDSPVHCLLPPLITCLPGLSALAHSPAFNTVGPNRVLLGPGLLAAPTVARGWLAVVVTTLTLAHLLSSSEWPYSVPISLLPVLPQALCTHFLLPDILCLLIVTWLSSLIHSGLSSKATSLEGALLDRPGSGSPSTPL